MFIKQIVVCGFKSYKDKTVVDEFDPGFNIIVGRNGSGKSNLFAAIEFALTLEYRNLRSTERNALLYLGHSSHEPSYVEIVFDNTDRKLPLSEDTVTFRRLIATKKDKFFVNGKELRNARQFLDMAGFTNPYFIVKQGKVHQLAVGSDAYRLKLLEDVAGSTAYDEKINDFNKSLTAGESKKEEIEKFLQRLDERKTTLVTEASELDEFLKCDQIRRAIEYVLNDREQEVAKKKIQECEEEREKFNEQLIPYQTTLKELDIQSESYEKELSKIQQQIQRIEYKKELAEADIPSLIAEREKLKNLKDDIDKKLAEAVLNKSKNMESSKLAKRLNKEEKHLETITVELDEAILAEQAAARAMIKTEAAMTALEAQLQRSGDFADVKQRDKWLNKEISGLKKTIEEKSKVIERAQDNSRNLDEQRKEFSKRREEVKSSLEDIRVEISNLERAAGHPETALINWRKTKTDLWRSLNEVDHSLANEKEIHLKITEQMYKRVGRPIMQGWEGVKTVLKKFEERGATDILDNYFGLVIENIQCDENVDLAVEAAAGNKLFHHIVKDHRTSMTIMKEFNRQKLRGEVSFIPIEGISVHEVQYPEDQRSVRPLLSNVEYPAVVEKVAKFIFGKTLVCQALAAATVSAKLYKMNCVTLEGDMAQKNGPITGGYVQSSVGRLELQRGKLHSEKKLKKFTDKKAEIERQLNETGKLIEEAAKKSESRESKKCALRAEREKLSCELKVLQEKIKYIDLIDAQERKNIESQNQQLLELKYRVSNLEKEMKQPLVSLSQADKQGVQNLRKELKTLVNTRSRLLASRTEKEREKNASELKILQLSELLEEERNKSVDIASSQENQQRIQEIEQTIEALSDQIAMKRKEGDAIADTLPEVKAELNAKKKQIEKLREEKNKTEMKLLCFAKDLEKLTSDYYTYQNKLQDLQTTCSALGSIPSSTNKYTKKDSKSLYERLKKINVFLKKKDGVNQKAAEQYQELSEKYDSFQQRLADLDSERKELLLLIKDLEDKKGAAILKNFRVLQDQFKEIFGKIVVRGDAELVLYGSNFEITSETLADSDRLRQLAGRNKFTGVKINVNFVNRRALEMRNLLQLSGGQKSVVALTLILAIQKIDPVPFYLFDEVDQALDPIYRRAVTEVIYEMATEFKLQFICTTFRREFLAGAHKFFGVSYHNKCSSIRAVSQDEALDFVENDSVGSSSSESGNGSSDPPPDSSQNGDRNLMPPPRPKRPPPRSYRNDSQSSSSQSSSDSQSQTGFKKRNVQGSPEMGSGSSVGNDESAEDSEMDDDPFADNDNMKINSFNSSISLHDQDQDDFLNTTGASDVMNATGASDVLNATGASDFLNATGTSDFLDATRSSDLLDATRSSDFLNATGASMDIDNEESSSVNGDKISPILDSIPNSLEVYSSSNSLEA